MPRSIWTGSISFGLVNIPVRIFSAVHEHKLRFHLAHRPDGGAIGYQKICKTENEPVPDDEIVKVYEVEKGKLVEMSDEDFAAARVEGARTIELEEFVAYEEIDPSFFSHTYLVGPQDGAERPYALLVEAMSRSGAAGIGRFVMRGRQYLGCLRIRSGILTLEQMYFADEVDPPQSVIPSELPSVAKRELEMALSLIDSFSGSWDAERFKDTYHDALCEVIRRKQAGETLRAAPEPEEEPTIDMMEALRASIRQAKSGAKRSDARSRGGGNGRPPARRRELESLGKRELQERARKLDVPGRSSMSKSELAEAVASRS